MGPSAYGERRLTSNRGPVSLSGVSADGRPSFSRHNSELLRRQSMRGAKSAKWVVGAVIVALAATACGGDNKDDKSTGSGKAGGTFSLGITEPVAIDPVNAQES